MSSGMPRAAALAGSHATLTPSLRPVPQSQVYGQRWRVTGTIAEGGMSVVHSAEHVLSGARVALKVLRDGSEEAAERFRREASLLAGFGCSGIVAIYDAGEEDDGSLYIAMERLHGRTFKETFTDSDVSAQKRLALFVDLAKALSAAHSAGVVHRDLKPTNVFVTVGPEARVKILDFGIARAKEHLDITSLGVALGTPHYMSPEQFRDARSCGPSSDLWSLAVMVFEAIEGSRPFEGTTSSSVAVAICTEATPPMPKLSALSPRLAAIIESCLQKDPAERSNDALLFAEHLEQVLEEAAPRGSSFSPPQPEATTLPKPTWLQTSGASALGVAGGVVVSSILFSTAGGSRVLSFGGTLVSLLCAAGIGAIAAMVIHRRRQNERTPRTERSITVSMAPSPRESIAAPALGGQDDSVPTPVLRFFGDLAGDATRGALPTLTRLRAHYGERVRIEWRHNPSTDRGYAFAAIGIELFRQKDAAVFFRYAELLVAARKRPSDDDALFIAEQLGADMFALRRALSRRLHWLSTERDRALAGTLLGEEGGRGAGGQVFFTDHRSFSAETPFEVICDVIDTLFIPVGANDHTQATPLGGSVQPEQSLRLQQILVQWTAIRTSNLRLVRSRQQAQSRAEGLMRRAQDPTTDFLSLGNHYSDGDVDLGAVVLQNLAPALRGAALALRPGEVSGLVESSLGFHILRRTLG